MKIYNASPAGAHIKPIKYVEQRQRKRKRFGLNIPDCEFSRTAFTLRIVMHVHRDEQFMLQMYCDV